MDLVCIRSRVASGVRQRSGLNKYISGGGRSGKVQRALGQRQRPRQAVGAVPHCKRAGSADRKIACSGNGSGPGSIVPGSVAQLDRGILGNIQLSRGRICPGKNQLVASLNAQGGRINHIPGIKQVPCRTRVIDAVGSGSSQGNCLDEFARIQRGRRTAVAKGKDGIPTAGMHRSRKTGEIPRQNGRQSRVSGRCYSEVGPRLARQASRQNQRLVGIAVQPSPSGHHMDIGINGIGGGIDKKAAPIQFQPGAADCSGIGKADFIPRSVGAVARQSHGTGKAAVVSGNGIAAAAGEGTSFLLPENQRSGSGNAA